jgi:outer membrane protein OmpA-like peptidoglycan-associated protein
MILMISAAMLGAVGGDAREAAQPLEGFIICPGDARCPTGGRKPPQGFIICPGDRRCPPGAVVVPSPAYIDCPDGSRAMDGMQCPVAMIPPRIVFFPWDSAELIGAAREQLNQVADDYRRGGSVQIRLEGHTDRSGSESYNLALSERRAAAVRDYLLAMGVISTAITVKGWGESRPQVETDDGMREPNNRRVEILFGPGSE